MAVGDWHQVGDYGFRETQFGPMVPRSCVDCRTECFATLEAVDPRCLDCMRNFHGVAPTSVKPLRQRFLRVAPGLTGDRARTADELKMAAARKLYAPGGTCVSCGYPLDPVHREEGYDTHPTCDVRAMADDPVDLR
jgi:hypothetical protein